MCTNLSKIIGVTDGWLDGDMEFNISIYSAAGTSTVNLPFLGEVTINFLVYYFLSVYGVDHDGGSWSGVYFSNSNKETEIKSYRKWSERDAVTIEGVLIYNNAFTVRIVEDDPVDDDDDYPLLSFNKNTFSWGNTLNFQDGNEKIFLKLDSGNYPHIVYQ